MGCNMEVTLDREKGIVENVLDNGCPRGAKYAEKELLNPTRTLTTTIKVLQGNLAVVPVKSKDELPKDKLLQYMEVIRRTSVKAPIKVGDILIKDILGSGIDIVACADVDRD
jgi:CxxC motif-containing protein